MLLIRVQEQQELKILGKCFFDIVCVLTARVYFCSLYQKDELIYDYLDDQFNVCIAILCMCACI